MSCLPEEVDRAFGAVGRRPAGLVLLARRHGAVAEDRPVALVVVAEQAGDEVIAPAVPLAAFGVDLHFQCVVPVCAVMRVGASALTRRVSSVAHCSSSTACRSSVTSALPIDS